MRNFFAVIFVAAFVTIASAEITGNVTDTRTGEPIAEFSLVFRPAKSATRSPWQQHTRKKFTAGKFSATLPRGWGDVHLRVQAAGYTPFVTIARRADDTFEIDLQRDPGVRGKVVTADGLPVAGAAIALSTLTANASIDDGSLRVGGEEAIDARIVRSADDGIFVLPTEIDPGWIVVVHEKGCANADPEKLDQPIVLQAWATIEGRFLLGSKAAADWGVNVQRSFGGQDASWVSYYSDYQCTADGRFTATHVPPGKVSVCPLVKSQRSSTPIFPVAARVIVAPGQTKKLTLGGEGRPVIGRLVAGNGANVDWSTRKLTFRLPAPHIGFPGDQEIWDAQAKFFKAIEGANYGATVTPNPDGTFHIERLSPGEYQISGWPVNNRQSRLMIDPIDAGISDEPLDLGEMKVLMNP